MLTALDLYLGPTPQIVIVADNRQADTAALLRSLRQMFLPNKVVACRAAESLATGSAALAPLFAGKGSAGTEPLVFVCEDFRCQAPRQGRAAAEEAWRQLSARRYN
jgi:uncharacterized protein YyaL (SSP411 family)